MKTKIESYHDVTLDEWDTIRDWSAKESNLAQSNWNIIGKRYLDSSTIIKVLLERVDELQRLID